ncbi:MAG: autotransporter domain-containing protein [Elusimicrobiota bacterium]|nr:autotransporter domain-containing protein [Elusimicrobiota bacterium]
MVGNWDSFVAAYKNGGTIMLDNNITADENSSIIGQTNGNNITIDGSNNTLDSNEINNLGFVLNSKNILFRNITFSNFISDINGGAVMTISNGSKINFTGNINFTNNSNSGAGGAIYLTDISNITFTNSLITFTGNVSQNQTPNDVYLDGFATALIFSDNTTLASGIQTSGGGAVRKTGSGSLIVQGDKDNPTIIDNNFSVEGGAVEFQNSVSTIAALNVRNGATIALANTDVVVSSLYVTGNFTSNGILTMDVNLETGEADWISVEGNLTLANSQLQINTIQADQKGLAKIITFSNTANLNGLSVSGDYDFMQKDNDIYIGLAWHIFVTEFEESGIIDLNKNVTATGSEQFANTTADEISINGNGKTLNSNSIEGLGFVVGSNKTQILMIRNVSLSNFMNSTLENGGAAKAQNNSMIVISGRVGFYNNQTGGNANPNSFNNLTDDGGKLNDIYLADASSISFVENVVLTNGIRTAGTGTLEKTGQGEVSFEGSNSVIENTFNFSGGALTFKSALSSITFLETQSATTLSLENNQAGNKLFVETLILRSDVIFEIDFASGIGDEIFGSSITIYTGRNLQIINSNIYTLNVSEVPIIKTSSDTIFILNDAGQASDLLNIFNYDANLFQLRFDAASGIIYVRNIPINDINVAETENEIEVQAIINTIPALKIPISQMDATDQRKALDSLTGSFIANVFKAAARTDSKILSNQIKQTSNYETWLNVYYDELTFKNEKQLLGDFNSASFNANLGRDLFAADFIRLGAQMSVESKSFEQGNNTAKIFEFAPSIYSAVKFYGLNIGAMFGLGFGSGKSKRVIDVGVDDGAEKFSPEANLEYRAFELALNIDYVFRISPNIKISPFANFQTTQLNIDDITETSDPDKKAANLHFASQSIPKTLTKLGWEFNVDISQYTFFINAFVGLDLSGDKKFQANFAQGNKKGFEIESDDPQKTFYGGQVGAGYKISRSFSVKVYSGLQLNDKLTNYNFGAGIYYKIPPKKVSRTASAKRGPPKAMNGRQKHPVRAKKVIKGR